ncbi:hypothetical protein JTB14_034168 [Gonioctena quinquepunctata]|nr:hypothetical protein JTB14_034168 [Gonioctena quinquepunctata]
MLVCSKHFQSSDYLGNTKFLKQNADPSVNLPALQHGLCHDNSEGPTVCGENDTQCVSTVDEQPTVDDIQAAEALILLLGEQNNLKLQKQQALKTNRRKNTFQITSPKRYLKSLN